MAAIRSTSRVVRQIPCAEEASDPPMAYRILTRFRAAVISLSVSLSGSICAPLVAEDLLEQLTSELPLRKPQEDLAFAGPRVRLANAGLAQLADHRRVFDGPLELHFRRYLPHQVHPDLPRFRRCVGGPHTTLRESRSEEHTSELQSLRHLVCRLL